jgi:hypothetical protein
MKPKWFFIQGGRAVIQVSSPIQAQSSSGLEPEAVSVDPVESGRSQKSRKNDKMGVFAKLLDGLTGKAKKRAAGTNNHTAIHETEETPLPSFLKKAKGPVGKSEKNSTDSLDLLNFPDFPDSTNGEGLHLLGLLGQDKALTGQNPVLKAELDGESADSVLTNAESPVAGTDKTREIPSFKGYVPGTDSVSQDEQVPEGEFLATGGTAKAGDAAKAGETGSSPHILTKEEHPETKTAASGRGAVDMRASARNPDGELYQFAGTPRPGLVDSLSGAPGEAPEGRLSEGRKKGRDRLNPGVKSSNVSGSTGEIREAGVSETLKSPGFGGGAEKADLEIQAEIRVEAGFKGREGGADSGGESRSQGLENTLARELRENLGADIVKQASILVRNQQEGSIRLTLKPETLGNIKIRLEMAENKITGHIVVESSEALKAFERELPVLEKAFRDSGFSEANLDMSMARNGEGYGQEREGGDFRDFSPALAASRYDAGMAGGELIPEGFFPETSGEKAVNMLV